MSENEYTGEFYEAHQQAARRSAEVIVPIVMELVSPASVVDLGCGIGTWLAAFARRGVDDVLGVDGDWVSVDMLEIPRDRFVVARLDRVFTLDRRFDLALSLEVAEHLPEHAAKGLVTSLTGLAPSVLFSAAIPHQRGRQHVNEQWPEYWAALFAAHGYVVVDAIRPRVWSNASVSRWYRQNAMLYAREDVLAASPALARERERTAESMLSLVHPEQLTDVAGDPDGHARRLMARELSLRELVYAAPHVVSRSLRWRLGRLRRR
jgi:SAM-dependent methyltransferase